MVLTVSHASPPRSQQPLDKDLRGYLDTNRDVVTRITKPVSIDNVGALSAQSEQPILFENIIEKPGFRLCDILVKHRSLHACALRCQAGALPTDACLSVAAAAASLYPR
jgi:hypothetical protein